MRNKQPMIFCDFCGNSNHIEDKCIARDPTFQPPNISQIVAQYNAKNEPNPKLEPIDWNLDRVQDSLRNKSSI